MSEPLRFWWLYNLLSLSGTHSSSTESWCLLLALTQQFPVPVWTFLCYSICVFVCAQLLLYTLHHCIVNSLLTKLLNGIAYYFWGFFLHLFLSPLLRHSSLPAADHRWKDWQWVFYFSFWKPSLVTCRFDRSYMWAACRWTLERINSALQLHICATQDWRSHCAIGRLPFTQPNAI